jgi:hypothetical protein
MLDILIPLTFLVLVVLQIYITPELVFSVAPSIDYQKSPVTAICSVHDECYYHVKETAEEVVSMLTGVEDVYLR